MTITSLCIVCSPFSAKGPDELHQQLQMGQITRKKKDWIQYYAQIWEKSKFKTEWKFVSHKFSDLFGHKSLQWPQHSLV